MLLGLWQDIRHSARSLAKSPGFVAAVLISLGLGIGINTAMFSVIHTAMERPVSGRAPDRLVDLSLGAPAGTMLFSFPEYLQVQRGARAFSDVMGLMQARYRVSGSGKPELVTALVTSPNFFTGFQQEPSLGRGFSRDETGLPEVVLGQAFWRRRFGGDASVIGKSLILYQGAKRSTYTIVGVLPRSFRYASMWAPDIVVPFPDDFAMRSADARVISIMARLKPGASLAQARSDTEALVRQLRAISPQSLGKARLDLRPKVRRDAATRAVAGILQAVVGLVLLIACVNVMNLLLARHQARRPEIAARLALGSSRGRLMRLLLMESLALAVPAALAGYGSAVLILHVVERTPIPGLEGIQMYFYLDRTVLCFALLAGVAATVLAGLWPARAAIGLDLVPALKGGGSAIGRRKFGLRGVLVAAQLALSTVGITAAAMLTRSAWDLNQFDSGADPNRILTATMWPEMNGYNPDRAVEFRRELGSRLRAQPGVRAVAFAAAVPGGGEVRMQRILAAGSARLPDREAVAVRSNAVAPGFFRVFGIEMLRGREYAESDVGGRPRCVVNNAMARRFWPDREPLGQTVRLDGPKPTDYEVIGVARDTAYERNGDDPSPFLYLPLAPSDLLTVFVHTGAQAGSFAEPLRRTVAALEPEMPVQNIEALVERLTGGPNGTELRLRAGVMGTLGTTALLLSGLGLYGVITYVVSRRTREIGIRLALGASRANVLGAVLSDGLRLVSVGLALGVSLSLVICPLLANRLYGVRPNSPGVIAASCAILLTVALVSMLLPARRVCSLEPLTALRHE